MSGELSNIQKNSLAGQILLKLGVNEEGKIDRQKWNSLWEQYNLTSYKGKPENRELDGEDDIDIQEAFEYIMTRIFNAAKAKIDNNKWSENGVDKSNAIKEVAKDWLQKAANIEIQDDEDAKEKIDNEESEEVENNPAKQALNNAENCVKKLAGTTSAVKNAIASINQHINSALNAASIEEAENMISQAEAEIKTAKESLQEAEKMIEQSRNGIESATQEQGYTNINESLSSATNAIGNANIQIEDLENRLSQVKSEISNKFTADNVEQKQRPKTVDDLKEMKVNVEAKRLINGEKQEYYKYDFNGETIRAIKTETGELDELIEISDGLLKKKEFITVSQLKKATNSDISQLPDGIRCECEKLENGEIKLTFLNNSGIVDASKIKNYPESMIDDNFRNQLKTIETGVKNLPEYTINEDGSYNIQFADDSEIGDINKNYFSGIKHKVLTKKEDGYYYKGPIKVKEPKDDSQETTQQALTKLDNQYNAYVQQLSVRGEIYKSLLNKPTDKLTSGEKAFMKKYEIQAYKFINEYETKNNAIKDKVIPKIKNNIKDKTNVALKKLGLSGKTKQKDNVPQEPAV